MARGPRCALVRPHVSCSDYTIPNMLLRDLSYAAMGLLPHICHDDTAGKSCVLRPDDPLFLYRARKTRSCNENAGSQLGASTQASPCWDSVVKLWSCLSQI